MPSTASDIGGSWRSIGAGAEWGLWRSAGVRRASTCNVVRRRWIAGESGSAAPSVGVRGGAVAGTTAL